MALSIMYPDKVIAPSGPVDMYWHFLILNTRVYKRFSLNVYGSRCQYQENLLKVPDPQRTYDVFESWNYFKPQNHKKAKNLKALDCYDLSTVTLRFVDEGRFFAPEQKYPIIAHLGKHDLETSIMLENEFRKFIALMIISDQEKWALSGPVDMY
ncbi:MAG: hypothetical protein OXT67_10065 [Zetaproteobacteria bacterium]|nr:hypothetical protein [Zetaproteobacteria bacterium]